MAGTGEFAVEVILTASRRRPSTAGSSWRRPRRARRRRRSRRPTACSGRYSGPGGLQEELVTQAAAHPAIAELQVIGQTVHGQDINAVRVHGRRRRGRGRDAARRPCTSAPSTPGSGSRRRWSGASSTTCSTATAPIAAHHRPRRHHRAVVRPRRQPRRLRLHVRGRPAAVAQEPARQQRQRADHHAGDGVDLNRNCPTRWGYDNEGSSPNPSSDTYRGPAPASEPETQALDSLFARITPEFFVNYHSAAELLLYGIGWQVATPSPDDVLYEAMVGDDAEPGRPRLRPRHRRRAVHDQRRHRHAHAGGLRHARVHPGDVDVRGGVGVRSRRRVGGRGLRQRLRVPRRRGA